jgi:hypothetical protein
VVNDHGRKGIVVDTATGRITMELDGGDYFPETVPFASSFAEYHGRSVLVHRTDWNRLDVSDPQSGEVLTQRGPTCYERGESRPDHYLDYFHGRLCLSPDGSALLDDGWIWHPVGAVTVWSLDRWLNDNVWESEDGPSRAELCWRDWYWDRGMCWAGRDRVVVGGLGNDADFILPGARIFAREADGRWREVLTFAGPQGDFFADRSYLFTAHESGLTLWDLTDGARRARIDGFRPSRMHPLSHECVEIGPQQLRFWTPPAEL